MSSSTQVAPSTDDTELKPRERQWTDAVFLRTEKGQIYPCLTTAVMCVRGDSIFERFPWHRVPASHLSGLVCKTAVTDDPL